MLCLMTDTTLLQTCHEYHEYRDVAYFLYKFCTQLQCSYCLNNRTELRYFIISFVFFAPGLCVTCQFIFKLVLFEIALLFRITVKQTATMSCVMIVMITFWTKYLTPFFSCHIKAIRPYFLQTNGCILSKILLLFISQC